MSEHLLQVTLGPVQEFIAQARRTRDLWFGSHLLSELSRAVARRLVSENRDDRAGLQPVRAQLIFPALSFADPELEPCDELLRSQGQVPVAPVAIANKILAHLPDGVEPRWAAAQARAAAQQRWGQLAAKVRLRCARLIEPAALAAFDAQIASFLEFHAAWIAYEPEGYNDNLEALDRALSGRKCLRDFAPLPNQRGGVPKSSLDGGRETVLREAAARDAGDVRRYRIAPGEQLDAVGLVKRAGGEPGQFVPITNIALAPWIERAAQIVPQPLEQLRKACNEVGIGGVDRPELGWVRAFPFDAQVFLPSRWRPLLQEIRGVDPGKRGDQQRLRAVSEEASDWGRRNVRPLFGPGRMGEPLPYVACLVADGDRVGATLRELHREQHVAFSRGLSGFPQRARQIIEGRRRGVLVYAGGDDVLAFLCLEDALLCADELRRAFEEVMADALPAAVRRPTLSVGIGVGHVLDSLGHLRTLGRRAEEQAKRHPGRNRLVVLLDKRSGGELSWEESWEQDPVGQLQQAMDILEHRVSHKKVYEIIADVQKTPHPGVLLGAEEPAWAKLLKDDVTRTLKRAEQERLVWPAGVTPEEAGLRFAAQETYPRRRQRILDWGNKMLIARFFAQARSLEPLPPGVA